jgi:hypothetical protein
MTQPFSSAEDLQAPHPNVAEWVNRSGAAVNYGDVVVLDGVNDFGFTTTTTAGLSTKQIAVVLERFGIANLALGRLAIGGSIPKINLTAPATPGQLIGTGVVAGKGTPHNPPQIEGDFAVALRGGIAPEAILFGHPNSPGGAGGLSASGFQLNDGSVLYAPIFPGIVTPVDGDFAWVNQGGASVNAAQNGIFLTDPGGTASDHIRLRVKNIPAAPYVVTMGFIPLRLALQFLSIGLILYDSASAKSASLQLTQDAFTGQTIAVVKFTNNTTFSATYIAPPFSGVPGQALFFRFEDDGVNRKAWWSADNVNFLLLHSVLNNDFLVPDKIGFMANANNGTFGVGMTVFHWKQA